MKHDHIKYIAVLGAICLVMSLMLALINSVTKPIIEATETEMAEKARMEVLPEADGFTKVEVDLPADSSVTDVYEADNGAGYVFSITCDGYGGKDTMKISCGLDEEGTVVSTKVLSHKETAGSGTRIMEEDFAGQFLGIGHSELDGVDTISGATVSSEYFIEAMRSAFEAYELVCGQGGQK